MVGLQKIEIEGKRFILLEEGEYERLYRAAHHEDALAESTLPDLPDGNTNGRIPALAFARASLARDLIRARRAAGLSRQQLATLAQVREATIARAESGNFTARPTTVDKIMAAIESAKQTRRRAHNR